MDLLKDIQLDSISTAVGGLTSTKDVDKHVRLTTSKLIREINVATTTVAVLAEVSLFFIPPILAQKDLRLELVLDFVGAFNVPPL